MSEALSGDSVPLLSYSEVFLQSYLPGMGFAFSLSSPSPIPVNGLALPTLPSLCRSFGIGNCRDTTAMEPFLFPQTRSGTVHQSL